MASVEIKDSCCPECSGDLMYSTLKDEYSCNACSFFITKAELLEAIK